jgi:nitrous oxidase accessory protein
VALAALLVAALASASGADMPPIAPGGIEGRPAATEASPLQALVDAAAPGATLTVPAGTYAGDLTIDRPLRLVGTGRPRLVRESVRARNPGLRSIERATIVQVRPAVMW